MELALFLKGEKLVNEIRSDSKRLALLRKYFKASRDNTQNCTFTLRFDNGQKSSTIALERGEFILVGSYLLDETNKRLKDLEAKLEKI